MLSVIFGLIAIVVGVVWLAMWGAWNEFIVVLQGSVPPFLVLVGLVAVAAGISSIKDNMAAKKEENKAGEGETSAGESTTENKPEGSGESSGGESQ